MTILYIAGNALRRLFRNKLLIVTTIAALVIIGTVASSLVSVGMSIKDSGTHLPEMVLSLTALFANLAALVTGATVTRSEIRDGTIISVMSKPVRRWEYLLGSFLGGVAYILLAWIVLDLLYLGLIAAAGQPLGAVHFVKLLGAAALSVLILSITFCLAQRFSVWIAAVLGVVIYNGVSIVRGLIGLLRLASPALPESLATFLTFPFPDTERLDSLFRSSSQATLEPPGLGWTFLHFADYAVLMLLFAWWLFRHQDLSRPAE